MSAAPLRRTAYAGHIGMGLLGLVAVVALLAPWVSPNDPAVVFADRAYAPPTMIHLYDGGLRAPFIYRQVLEDRLDRRYREDRSEVVPVAWFSGGRFWSVASEGGPLLLLGADDLGRDIFSRLVHGARLTLGVALVGVLGAVLIGAWAGAVAGSVGGATESTLMFLADFLIVLPGAYLVLVLRGVLPETLSTTEVFILMSCLFALAGWPQVARGVRAIVATERARDYAEAARSIGVGPMRLALHLLPAARGFVLVQVILLVPALVLAEVTISFLGLGFDADVSWGSMLQSAAAVSVMREAPWMLAPAVGLFLVTLACQLLVGTKGEASALRLAPVESPLTAAGPGR